MYPKLDYQGGICGFLMVRVGDLLYTGEVEFLPLVKKEVDQFMVGETDVLSSTESRAFGGLEIQTGPNNCSILSQETYACELPTMGITSYVNQQGLKNAPEIKSTFRQGIGSLIWIHHSRPDVGFSITKLAADLIQSCFRID